MPFPDISYSNQVSQALSKRLYELTLGHKRESLNCHPAKSLSDVQSAYHLIYESYVAKGYCEPNDSKQHYHLFSLLPESQLFVLKEGKKLLGTLSLIPETNFGLPMNEPFAQILRQLRQEGRRIAEVSLLAVDHQSFQKNNPGYAELHKLTAVFYMFKIMFDYARFVTQATDLVIAIHPKMEDLYRYLNFKKISEPKSYPAACDNPAIAMRLDIEELLQNHSDSEGVLKYFIHHPPDAEHFDDNFEWDADSVKQFLPTIGILPQAYQDYLKSRYPAIDFN